MLQQGRITKDEHVYLLWLSLWQECAVRFKRWERVAFDSAPVLIAGVVKVSIELLTPVAVTRVSLGGKYSKPVLAKIKKAATLQWEVQKETSDVLTRRIKLHLGSICFSHIGAIGDPIEQFDFIMKRDIWNYRAAINGEQFNNVSSTVVNL